MSGNRRDLNGVQVFECSAQGPALLNDRDAMTIIEQAIAEGAGLIVVPICRLHPDFFELRNRLAGEFLQKFVNYRLRVAIIGDISERTSESEALRALIHESNRGSQLWFLADMGELEERLARQGKGLP